MKKMLPLLFLFVLIFVACNTTEGDLSSKTKFKAFDEAPYIIGQITNIRWTYIGKDSVTTILVEQNPKVYGTDKIGGEKISFFVGDETEIFFQKKNKNHEAFPKEKLKANQIIGGWITGYILESYPPQGGAKRIVVIDK